MFIHTQGSLLAFTLPAGITSGGDKAHPEYATGIQPAWTMRYCSFDLSQWDLSDHWRSSVGVPMRCLQRIAIGEPVWLQEWDDFGEHAADVLRHVGVEQFHVLRPLCDLYDASPAEVMRAITEYDLAADVSTRRLFDNVRQGAEPRNQDSVGWRYRARTSAWLLGHAPLIDYPVAQTLGYRGSVVERMEGRPAGDVPERFDGAYIDAKKAVESFVQHTVIAAKMALDTPQPVTVTTNRGEAVFQNVRVSPSIRGLRVDLPTGGRLFYREASLRPGNGDLIHKGRPLARRRIAHDILRQTALDVAVMSEWHVRNDKPPHAQFTDFQSWSTWALSTARIGAVWGVEPTAAMVGALGF